MRGVRGLRRVGSLLILGVILPGLLLAACGDEAATANADLNARATASPTATPKPTDTIRPTSTLRPTPTIAPTTEAVSAASSRTPGVTPSATPIARGGSLPFAKYIDPRFLTGLEAGNRSHYIQPWRAYLETVPASVFVNGIGINYNPETTEEDGHNLLMQHLARNGFKKVRVDFGWSNFSYENESELTDGEVDQAQISLILKAAKANGLRPVIVLSVDDANPAPAEHLERTVMKDTPKGSTVLQLDDVMGLKPDYSGMNDPVDGRAAGLIITEVDQNAKTITLSRPLPDDLKLGEDISITTLKYRPFGPEKLADGSSNQAFSDTLTGWKHFVANATNAFKQILGTGNQPDAGFDLEIWNGSGSIKFLDINLYYADGKPIFPGYKPEASASAIVKATADYVKDPANKLGGVKVSDGFGAAFNNIGSGNEPPGINAISKSARIQTYDFGADKNFPDAKIVGADLKVDSIGFEPDYKAALPEFGGTAIGPYNLLRDFGPINSEVNSVKHGRSANGSPLAGWITTSGFDFNGDARKSDVNSVLYIKAKMTARYLTFYLNKGANLLTLSDVNGGDENTGLVLDRLLRISRKAGVQYPAPSDEADFTSLAILVIRGMTTRFKEGLDPNLTADNTRPLEVDITDEHGKSQFSGNKNNPTLFDREVLAVLPYQLNGGKDLANKSKFIIPYYVMTRDMLGIYNDQKKDGLQTDLPAETFVLTIRNLKGEGAKVSVYDPINDKSVPVEVVSSSANSLQVKVSATDYPYLLTVEE